MNNRSMRYYYKGFVKDKEFSYDEIVYETNKRTISVKGHWSYGTLYTLTNIIPQSLCSCTTIKDKNNKLIFENDKVKLYNAVTGYIVFERGCFFVEIQNKIKQPLFTLKEEDIEIIGTVECFKSLYN